MAYHISRIVDRPFDEALEKIIDSLREEGFGVLTDIDVQATLKKKLDADMSSYRILGMCNPAFAWEAIQKEPLIGTLLPCNVIVRAVENGTQIAAVDPMVSMQGVENPDLASLAEQVRARLSRAVARVS